MKGELNEINSRNVTFLGIRHRPIFYEYVGAISFVDKFHLFPETNCSRSYSVRNNGVEL